jgi:D-tagatose-1,6-bisphosphate aldolase subunit GatZ/KbaZ
MSAIENFREILRANKKGHSAGIYSVCSAHETVLKAAMLQATEDNSILLIESTSNQVNQDGGYTGMRPRDFAALVGRLALEMDFDSSMILLGGDHLGPHTWSHLPPGEAMKRANILVHEYVKAGYHKIHLDASMFLSDDQGDRTKPLADEIVAGRAAELCLAAEHAWDVFRQGCPQLLYIIGTEVPVPGGAKEDKTITVTLAEDAARTIAIAKRAFERRQLQSAWERVCGVVVQPGVGFNHDRVSDYNHEATIELSDAIKKHEDLVYEAHSTDYQTPDALSQMIHDHFCILKVGPWLTFAYREALFALVEIEKNLFADDPAHQSLLRRRLETIMGHNPEHWEKYYPGTANQKKLKRKFSYLDRSRYYWPDRELQEARDKLFSNLRKAEIPPALISQYMPNQYLQIRQGRLHDDPEALMLSKIREVLSIYSEACRMKGIAINT